jgi:para-nitrobenzyl esterase
MKKLGALGILIILGSCLSFAAPKVKTDAGEVEGKTTADGKVQEFLGIPFAAPPVGDLRWKEPQPVKPWKGVRQTTEFGARCMQTNIFPDMVFRDSGPSEDCLYLNVWTPDASKKAKLPVMVWIFGGGFVAGATSEPRQDGQFLAHKGVVIVSMNYRLGIFGFFSHPELTKESPHYASGNYGLLDQTAALLWVKKNIANFGGDPSNITIFGESAGSFSVSAQMASPLSKNLIAQAIGESGAFFGRTLRAKPLDQSEQAGVEFAKSIGADSLAKLRAIPAQQLLEDASKPQGGFRFGPNIDGYFFPSTALDIYSKGEQAHVPLLAGWNHDEGTWPQFFGKDAPTKENFIAKVKEEFGDHADDILKAFPHDTDEQVKQSAAVLATANFISYGTWKWIELQSQTDDLPVYRYEFDQAPPAAPDAKEPWAGKFAYHSAEIEYVFGTLASKKLPFTPEDFKLSELMQTYWTNFAKTGSPNGNGVPPWPQYTKKDNHQVMYLSPNPMPKPDLQRDEYLAIDATAQQPSTAK